MAHVVSQRYALPSEWVAAIRDDALSVDGSIARERAGIQHKISAVRRVRIRIGRVYSTPFTKDTDYVPHPPVCQACGLRVKHGDRAIRYRYHRTRPSLGRIRYIHCTCPEESDVKHRTQHHEGRGRHRRHRRT